MKYCFILNPAAGKGTLVEELKKSIEERCLASNVSFEVYLTTGVGDASEYVRRTVAGCPDEDYRFYACGGDGTLCEVVGGAMSVVDRSRLSIGLIPSGTGNDFVRNFTVRENFFDIDAQIGAAEYAIDLIRCNDLYAINMINIGFDCEVVCKTARLKRKKWIPSKLAYIAGLVLTLIRKPGLRGRFSKNGGEAVDKQYLLNTYANGCFCGGGFYSNPNSDLQDGMIDALFVNHVTRRKFLSLVGDYKKGTHLQPKFEAILQSEKVERMDLYFDSETNVSVDGEIVQAKELHLSVERGALKFLIPAGSETIAKKKQPCEAVAAGAKK